MAIHCPKCHSDNPGTLKFCGECGTELRPSTGTEPKVTETIRTSIKELATGSTFAGRYQVIEELGRGGMGRVYKVFDSDIKEKIALKLLRPEIALDKETVERFSNELKLARRIGHRNVCRMFDLGKAEGTTFITMEYVHGEDLKSMIRMSGSLSLGMLLSVGKQVCDGLAEAHGLGVVHRDLKPQNIMIDRNGNAKIMDFGIARSVREKGITGPSVMIGTPEYMSPEQAEAKEVDARSDIYSLGVILYEMATSHVPFEGETALSIAMKHKGEKPKDPKQLNPGIPSDLSGVILKCLEKDRANRYQNASDLRAELEKIEKGVPTTERVVPERKPLTSRQITVQFSLKKLVVPASIAIAVLAVAGFLLILLGRKESAPAPKIKDSIAVISFENQTGDKAYDYLSKAIPSLLITSLEQRGGLYVATWERMADLLSQLGEKNAEVIGRESGFRLCRKEGIEAIVLGSFVKAGEMFATDVKVLNVETRKMLKSASSRGEGADSILRTQIDELSRAISGGLALTGERAGTGTAWIADMTTSSMEAYKYYLKGEEDLDKMYYDDALKSLEKAVELDPEFGIAYFTLSALHDMVGNIGASREAIEKARSLARKVTEKERLYIEAAYVGGVKHDREARNQLLEEIVRKYPREKLAHYWLGVIHRVNSRFEKAVEELNKTLALDPAYSAALNELGYVYLTLRDFGKSIDYFQKYASLNPHDANPLDSLAEAYLNMGRLDDAIAKYQEALAVKPEFLTSNYCIGYIHALKENPAEAEARMETFIAQAPGAGWKAEGKVLLAFYQGWLGRLDKGLGLLGEAEALRASVADTHGEAEIGYFRSFFHVLKGEFDLARKCNATWFDVFVRQHPEEEAFRKVEYLSVSSLIDLKQGRMDSARKNVSEAMSLLPKLAPSEKEWGAFIANLVQAEVHLAEGHPDRAIASFSNAAPPAPRGVQYAPEWARYNTPLYKDILARAYLQKGDIDRAIAEYEKLVTFDPGSRARFLVHPLYHFRLAMLYEQKGMKDKASGEFRKFLDLWKGADPGLPEVEDARKRLAGLR